MAGAVLTISQENVLKRVEYRNTVRSLLISLRRSDKFEETERCFNSATSTGEKEAVLRKLAIYLNNNPTTSNYIVAILRELGESRLSNLWTAKDIITKISADYNDTFAEYCEYSSSNSISGNGCGSVIASIVVIVVFICIISYLGMQF